MQYIQFNFFKKSSCLPLLEMALYTYCTTLGVSKRLMLKPILMLFSDSKII